MKKTTKGAVAAGAAALLLAGGAGSFAAWNASTTAGPSQTVTAGSMSVAQVDTGAWTWENGTTFTPGSDTLVPGDVVNYTAKYNINLVGTNLKAKLTPNLGGVEGDLKTYLNVTPANSTVTEYNAGTHTATFVTKIEFKPDTTNLDGSTKTASLAGGAVTLEQVLATP